MNILTQLMYEQWQEYFFRQYGPIQRWPHPYTYYTYYKTLKQIANHLTPQIYNHIYELSSTPKTIAQKLSRNQKRKIKKQALQKELYQQKKQIGDWVNLERKDLIQKLQQIQNRQNKIKENKTNKLGHLIQINRQIYKQIMKKQGNKFVAKIHQKQNKKKKSMIKKMKLKYLQNVNNKKQQIKKIKINQLQCEKQQINEEDEYVTDEQDQKKEIELINYNQVSKLTGTKQCSFFLREWVTNIVSEQLQDITLRLINKLSYKQAMKKINQPQKARKIIFSGVKEVKRTCKTIIDRKRARCVLIALNIQRNHLKKGIDDQIQNIIVSARLIKIPIIHVSTRAKLGRAFTGKFGPKIAVLSIVNFQGYQDMFQEMIEKWKIAVKKYQQL